MTQLEIEPETITELEATLIDRIHKMSIAAQCRLLEFINKSFPETAEETPEPEMSPAERRQKIVEIMGRLAERGGVMPGVDLVEWQREERKDRPLPGRED